MSTTRKLQITATSTKQTELLATKLAQRLKGGEILELESDLGGGKTTFTRGLVRGLGSTDMVSSPTFKICNTYHSPAFTIEHFDFYRLPTADLIANELADITHDPQRIIVIEWAGLVHDILPTERLKIHIRAEDENRRVFTFACPETLAYTIEGLQ